MERFNIVNTCRSYTGGGFFVSKFPNDCEFGLCATPALWIL